MSNSNTHSEVEITDALVARMWDCITGLSIYITHAEVKEALLCAFEQESCTRVKKLGE